MRRPAALIVFHGKLRTHGAQQGMTVIHSEVFLCRIRAHISAYASWIRIYKFILDFRFIHYQQAKEACDSLGTKQPAVATAAIPDSA